MDILYSSLEYPSMLESSEHIPLAVLPFVGLTEAVGLMECGGLNENSPHRPIGSGISRCGLLGVGVALLEEVCH